MIGVGSTDKVTIVGEGTALLELVYLNSCVATTLKEIVYTKYSNIPKTFKPVCPTDTFFVDDLDDDGLSTYTWSVKDSVWSKNRSNFALPKPKVNQPLSVYSTYSNDTISCAFHDTLEIIISETSSFEFLADSFFCANDSFVNLLDSSFIEPNNGIWIDSNSLNPIYDSFFLDPSKGKQGKVFDNIYYQTKHPVTGCTYSRKVGIGVHSLPKPWVVDSIRLCIGGPRILLNDGRYSNPTSGTWSGTGVEENDSLPLQYFSPTLVGINSTNTIYFQTSNEQGCTVKEPAIVTVNLKPDPVAFRRFATAPGSIAFRDNRDDADSCIVDWWFWDFHDPFAPNCTTAIDDASFDGTKCRYSLRENPVHYYTVSGTYDVTLVVKNTATGIQDERTRPDHVNLLGNSIEEKWTGTLSVYPNPNTGGFIVSTTETLPNGSYAIFNPLGKLIQSDRIWSRKQQINLDRPVTGIHLIVLFDEHGNKLEMQSVLVK